MNNLTIARAIHVLSIIIWVGGVGFVTAVLIPTIRRSTYKKEQLSIFNAIENRFALIARFAVAFAGISGIYMVYALNAWDRFTEIRYFWMHAMALLWLMFAIALFIIEPFFFKNHGRIVKEDCALTNLRKTEIVHWIIFILSLFTIFVSVLGAHGLLY